MKKIFLLVTTIIITQFAQAQNITDLDLFDFWVGKWNLTWDDGEGKVGKGTNNIVRIMDGKVIQENFEALEGNFKGFKGTSMSVFSPQRQTWKQAWTDNQGGYFDFTGAIDGKKRMFKTTPREKDSKTIIQRMVFYNIKDDSLTWDWESTQDGGKTWKLQWRINYERAK
ncbi:MAG: hypothetical protein JXQ96_18810 [Cyclobacteriaceae bacterium]